MAVTPLDVVARLRVVQSRIRDAEVTASRAPGSVQLVAVSKGHSAESVREAYGAGQRVFGESYAPELVKKASALSDLRDLRWRFIGKLQRNKARHVAPIANAVDSVDSLRLAQELAKRATGPLEVLIQVNVSGETQKNGCAPEEASELARAISQLAPLELTGLMTVPPRTTNAELSCTHFRALNRLATDLGLIERSMGMSADLEQAVTEGATLVRIGTAIFGPRQYPT